MSKTTAGLAKRGMYKEARMSTAMVGLAAVLALLLALSLAPEAEGWILPAPTEADDFNTFLTHLNGKYPLFKQILQQQGLDADIFKHLKGGGKLTVLAPTNAALQVYLNKPACAMGLKVDDKRVLTDHLIIGRFSTPSLVDKAVGTKFATLGPDKLSKLKTKPLTFGLMRRKKTLVSAKITETFSNYRISVFGISKVLYVCRK